MTFLPARQLSWRYGRGSRSLEDTLANKEDKGTQIRGGTLDGKKEAEEGEGFDVPEQVEDIIGQLLNGLRDKDTVVRWTAAKGYVMGRGEGQGEGQGYLHTHISESLRCVTIRGLG